jgi:hypothetical protein
MYCPFCAQMHGSGLGCLIVISLQQVLSVAWLVNFDRNCRHRRGRSTARSVNAKDLSVKLRDGH